ncbi:MAG: phosphatidate cytidylyltransferase [Vulcanimicrobiota bacterium]
MTSPPTPEAAWSAATGVFLLLLLGSGVCLFVPRYRKRFATLVALVPLIFLPAYWGAWVWALLVAGLTTGAAWEMASLGRNWPQPPGHRAGLIGLLPLAIHLHALCFTAVSVLLTLRRPRMLLLILMPGLSFSCLVVLRDQPQGFSKLVFLLMVVQLGEVAALLGGGVWGNRPLAPRVSPGKTREGAFCGLLGSGVAGLLFGGPLAYPGSQLLLVSLVLGLVAQAGDLLASALKRSVGLKDFGRLLPGHGGILDRFDGYLTAAPLSVLLL